MSPLKTFQASFDDTKHGIVAVLSSDSVSLSSKSHPSSLRRTLSADMSSRKWISHIKKVSSSQHFASNTNTNNKTEDETETADVWGSIFNSSKSVVHHTPYVHPLVKPSGKCLSDKSLEICTESLGSETGSDGFSSYPSSENGDSDDDDSKDGGKTPMFQLQDQWRPVKYSYKKSSPPRRSFPPPLPTLSGPDGESLRMQPRRDNGRLVLEAMSVPSQNNFRAQRHEGRLVLTLVNQVEEVDPSEDEQEEEEEEEGGRKMTKTSELPNGLLKAHRLASMINNKSIVLANRNPSLPPRPKAAQPTTPCATQAASESAAGWLNGYEYYWRSKAGAAVKPVGQPGTGLKNGMSRKIVICKNRTANEEEKMVSICSNGSCKEMRRRVVVWEPRCIATS